MKKSKLKLTAKILAIVVICLISFMGIYVQRTNKMENIIKGYELTKDLSGYREIILEVSDATQVLDSDGKIIGNTDDYNDDTIKSNEYKKTNTLVNSEENLTKGNYETTKNIIEKRLKEFGVEDYNLGLDKNTGMMYLQISENDNTDHVVSNIIEKGNFEIKDSEDGTVYIKNQNLKKVSSMYNTTETGTIVYLDIQLDEEGTSILKDITSNKYAKVENAIDENKVNEEKSTKKEEKEEVKQKEVVLAISGNNMITTSFEEPIENGIIDLSMNAASKDNKEINETLKTTSTIVTLLENGELPLEYKITKNQYVTTDISDVTIRNAIIIAGTILAILLVFMIIKNKARGILGVITYIGFVALYLLLIRYTNVAISISGAIAIAIICIINYILNMKLYSINKEDKNIFKQEYIKFIIKMIPLLIISIVFIFMKWIPLSSFGMILFWGIVLMVIYNILITNKIA